MLKRFYFLDFDGVFNCCGAHHFNEQHPHAHRIMSVQAGVFQSILTDNPGDIIVTSGWRHYIPHYGLAAFQWMLKTHGINANVIDYTELENKYDPADRLRQIDNYLVANRHIKHYMIIDDLELGCNNQLKTESDRGLKESHIQEAKLLWESILSDS